VMEQAKAEAMQTANTVKSWSEDAGAALSWVSGQMISKADLYDRYRTHCLQEGLTLVGHAEFFKRLKVIFPTAKEDRVVLTVNGVKQRVRRIGLALGVFDIEQPADDQNTGLNGKFMANVSTAKGQNADLNAMLMANIPTADGQNADLNAILTANIPGVDEDFDPFKNR